MKFLFVFQILLLSTNIYCQSVNLQKKDSLGNKTGLYKVYDIEHIRYSETMFVNNKAEYTNYFSRKGDTIFVTNWSFNTTAMTKIREKILNNFIVNDFTYASGSASLLLLVDCEKKIFEIRIMRGITESFNNELLRVINKIEKDLVFICATTDSKTPIVTPFAIRLNEDQAGADLPSKRICNPRN